MKQIKKQIKKNRKVRTQGLSNLRHQWLEVGNVILYEEHRCILDSDKKWLDDAIINAVQYFLHSQYGVPGFQATTLGYHLTFHIMRKGFIQILHNGEDHWFTISTLGLWTQNSRIQCPAGRVIRWTRNPVTPADVSLEAEQPPPQAPPRRSSRRHHLPDCFGLTGEECSIRQC